MDIQLLYPDSFSDYALIDSGNGERLEQFGDYVIRRPDPQVLWNRSLDTAVWERFDAHFVRAAAFRGVEEKGEWIHKKTLPQRWTLGWGHTQFYAELTPFKHVGVFPEQAVHWQWMSDILQKNTGARVLNLFGYTGIASVVCAQNGAKVTHVDASKPSITWAKDNMLASGLPADSIRWILEDVLAFIKREIRRGNTYDAVIMDPPVFGHGAQGEVWKFNEHFPELMLAVKQILAPSPLFIICNAYAVSASSVMLHNCFSDVFSSYKGNITCGELALRQENSERVLSTGIFARYSGL